MRHRIAGKQLCRDKDHRRALLRNLAAGLFEHGEIETTLPRAKAVQPFIERIITIAKKGGLAARRQIESRLTDRKVHVWVADPNVPDRRKTNDYFELPDADQIEFNRYGEVRKAPRLIQHVMTNIAPLFEDRDGGYTRIVKTGRHRLGDGGDLVILQLVGREDGPTIGGGSSRRREAANNRTAFAARLRKGDDATAKADAAPAAEADTATAVAEPEAPESAAPEATTEETKQDE
jgi:large subunit ribosomal protein L17